MATELEEASGTVDVLAYELQDGPLYRAVPAGTGEQIRAAHQAEAIKRRRLGVLIVLLLGVVGAVMFGLRYGQSIGAAWGVLCFAASVVRYRRPPYEGPELVERSMFPKVAAEHYDVASYSEEAFSSDSR